MNHKLLKSLNSIFGRALTDGDRLQEVLAARQIFFVHQNGMWQSQVVTEVEKNVDSKRTFQQRLEETEKKSSAYRESAATRIRELRAELAGIRMKKFHEIVREVADEDEGMFDGFGDNADLARFLVLEGYLDDTHYQYTSLFHAGRLSPNDHKFLISIRGYRNQEPDFPIDNPKEVIDAMRDEDFGRDYVLNVKIVDFLLADPATYTDQNRRMLGFIAADFARCERFLTSYYERGVMVDELVLHLSDAWPGFVPEAMDSTCSLIHVARIIKHLPDAQLESLAPQHPAFSTFVSERLSEVLAQDIDFPAERLTKLGLETTDLSSVETHPAFVRVLFEEGLYEISIDNLAFIFRTVLGIEDDVRPREQNYTLLLETRSEPLIGKVDDQFGDYVQNVLLRLPDNNRESVAAILQVMNRADVDSEQLIDFLKRQTASLPSLEDVPVALHGEVLRVGKIEPTWENCLAYRESESHDVDTLTDYLNSDDAIAALRGRTMPADKEASALRAFIFENDGLSDVAYDTYAQSLPYQFKAFPVSVGDEKMRILIDRNAVEFSVDNLTRLDGNPSMGVDFVKNNIGRFFELESDCALDDDFRQKLLETEITDTDRLKIIDKMDLSLLSNLPERAAVVGDLLARTGATIKGLDAATARAVILNSRPITTQISLLNKLHEILDDEQLRDVLKSMPAPISDIKPGWGAPKLENTPLNVEFVTWLKARSMISSWNVGGLFDDDIRIYLFRK